MIFLFFIFGVICDRKVDIELEARFNWTWDLDNVSFRITSIFISDQNFYFSVFFTDQGFLYWTLSNGYFKIWFLRENRQGFFLVPKNRWSERAKSNCRNFTNVVQICTLAILVNKMIYFCWNFSKKFHKIFLGEKNDSFPKWANHQTVLFLILIDIFFIRIFLTNFGNIFFNFELVVWPERQQKHLSPKTWSETATSNCRSCNFWKCNFFGDKLNSEKYFIGGIVHYSDHGHCLTLWPIIYGGFLTRIFLTVIFLTRFLTLIFLIHIF